VPNPFVTGMNQNTHRSHSRVLFAGQNSDAKGKYLDSSSNLAAMKSSPLRPSPLRFSQVNSSPPEPPTFKQESLAEPVNVRVANKLQKKRNKKKHKEYSASGSPSLKWRK